MLTPRAVRPLERHAGRPGGLAAVVARMRRRLESLFESRVAWAGLFLLCATPLLLWPVPTEEPQVLPAGSIAAADCIAPETREFVDEAATRSARETARARVRPVYDFDSQAPFIASSSARRTFEEGNGGPGSSDGTPVGTDGRVSTAARRACGYLAAALSRSQVEERFLRALRRVYERPIVSGVALLPASGQVTVRDPRAGREWEEDIRARAVPLDVARRDAIQALQEEGASPTEVEAVGPLLQDLVTPSLVFNGALSESRRQEAASSVEPLIDRVPKGKRLLRRGEVVDEATSGMLLAYVGASRGGPSARAGAVLLLGLVVLFMLRYADSHSRTPRAEGRLFPLLVLTTLIALTLDRGFFWLIDQLAGSPGVDTANGTIPYRFLIPLATGGMLITLLVGTRVGLAYTLLYLPLFGIMVGFELPILLYCLIGSLAAVYGGAGYRRRTAPIQGGLVLGAINAAAVLALLALPGAPPTVSRLVLEMGCGLGGGVLVAVLVSFLLPLLESIFNILTDVRLLELSNLNNALLRRLAVEAPGSYNHSVIVGSLAEAAAEAIGANALFCRVAAYYHDVGKLLKPSYFIENQREGRNRHDRLSPHMSALVIASHVKEGYELAKSYGLPKEVLDIIPQHHGTRKINFFYQKAMRAGHGESGVVHESDFRYPGPKPQTKEAAIFMLSDSIEAAARTLDNPSPSRFKGLIRKIVSDVVLDDQLDQSDLTFSDLERAEASFLRTLSSIYHHRIDYPGFDFEKVPERPFRGSRTHDGPPPSVNRWGR